MSRELLKRAVQELDSFWFTFDEEGKESPTYALIKEIEAELAKPDEPVAWLRVPVDFLQGDNEFLVCDHDHPEAFPVYTTPPDQSARIAELEAELAQAYKTVDENWVCHQQLAALQSNREILSRLKPIGYIPQHSAATIKRDGMWDACTLYRTKVDPTDVEVFL